MVRWIAAVAFLFGCASSVDGVPSEWSGSLGDAEPIKCDEGADDLPAERTERQARFWAEDPELRDVLGAALARLNAATGLGLTLDPAGFPVMWESLPEGTLGHAGRWRVSVRPGIDGALLEDVVLHEVAHKLGSGHVGPGEGVMARCLGAGPTLITSTDLTQICSAAPCSAFWPESP